MEVKYLCTPHDGTPGLAWIDFEKALLNVASGRTDDRGYSLADTFMGVDEGGLLGPAIDAARAPSVPPVVARGSPWPHGV